MMHWKKLKKKKKKFSLADQRQGPPFAAEHPSGPGHWLTAHPSGLQAVLPQLPHHLPGLSSLGSTSEKSSCVRNSKRKRIFFLPDKTIPFSWNDAAAATYANYRCNHSIHRLVHRALHPLRATRSSSTTSKCPWTTSSASHTRSAMLIRLAAIF